MQDLKFEIVNKISKLNFKTRDLSKISKFESISPPSVFIGSKLKYPLVNIGILSPLGKEEEAWIYDNAKFWAQNNFQIRDILNLRNSLLNSRFQSNVHEVNNKNKFVDIAKDVAISLKPVDLEIELSDNLSFKKSFDKILIPHGIVGSLKNARVTSNVSIDKKVDRVMNDEIKASEGLSYLYESGINEYSLSQILSVGVMGLKKDKKIVPTRWSITATDDSLTKHLLKNIRDYKWIENYELFFGEFLGNQYLIMLFPNVWSYELFELYYPGSSWNPSSDLKASTDYEGFSDRTNYASNCAGGYYASRLPIVEYLNSIKRQAGVLVIRLETPSYWASLGVWVVRESVRKALENKGRIFNDTLEFLNSVKQISKIKYDFDCEVIFNKSKLLRLYGTQKNLVEWF